MSGCVCVCTFCIEVKLHRVFYCISISRGPLGNIAVSGQRRRCNISVQTYLQRARTQAHGSAPGRRRAQLGGTGNFQSNCYGLTLKKLLVCTFKVLSEQTLLLNLNKCVCLVFVFCCLVDVYYCFLLRAPFGQYGPVAALYSALVCVPRHDSRPGPGGSRTAASCQRQA